MIAGGSAGPELADADRKRYFTGTHRALEPAHTLQRIQRHLRRMGITRIANITGLDRVGIPVALAVRPNARSLAVSQGKGLEADAARASAAMESIELWHAENLELAQHYASVRELGARGVPCADTERMARSGDAVSDTRRLFWVAGEDLLRGGPCQVPLECVSADYTLPLPGGSGVFSASSNGLAAGNSRDEALCHALCEVIERDAESLWRAAGAAALARTGVDAESIGAGPARQLLDRFQASEVEVRIWDIRSDVGVPAFCVLAVGDDRDWADPEFGAGCHPHPEVALCRALSEAAQARITFIAGSRDDLGEALYAPAQRARRRRECLRLAAAHRPARRFDPAAGVCHERFRDDLRWLLDRLAGAAIEQVLAVDLSHDEMGIPVQRVVVPGLEGPSGHQHCDYVPGPRARRVLGLTP